jgi:hypothetical protein
MTEEELKAEAKKLGYTVAKKPCYQCSCYMPYPNINHKNKNGKWKCVDNYRPIKFERKWWHGPMTRCEKIVEVITNDI